MLNVKVAFRLKVCCWYADERVFVNKANWSIESFEKVSIGIAKLLFQVNILHGQWLEFKIVNQSIEHLKKGNNIQYSTLRPFRRGQLGEDARGRHGERRGRPKEDTQEAGLDIKEAGSEQVSVCKLRGDLNWKNP